MSEITAQGSEAAHADCDLTNFAEVEGIADTAVRTFGHINTWVRVVVASVDAGFVETSLDRQIEKGVEVNSWDEHRFCRNCCLRPLPLRHRSCSLREEMQA